MADLFRLDGRIALVTGASRGLGLAMAEALAGQGAQVLLNGRDPATVDAAVARIEAAGGRAESMAFDVTDPEATLAAMATIKSRHGGLDILVNNAGVQHRQPITDWTDADFERILGINLTACFRLAREAAQADAAPKAMAASSRPARSPPFSGGRRSTPMSPPRPVSMGSPARWRPSSDPRASRSMPWPLATSPPSSIRPWSTTPRSPPGCASARRWVAGPSRTSWAAPSSSWPRTLRPTSPDTFWPWMAGSASASELTRPIAVDRR